jgi:sugar diacid utilization regulator
MNLPASGETETDLPLREQLSNLQALLALSMRMTDSEDEEKILRLAGTAVPSLARCRLIGAYLVDDGWHATKASAADAQLRVEVELQLAVVSTAGGAIAVGREKWGWAFPLRSLGRHFGFLAVTGADEPSPAEQFVLRVLAQQTGVALANARLHTQQRGQATELLDINSRLADTVAALERSTAIHDRLTRVAAAGDGQEGIAQAVHELTGFAVAVEDRYGNPRAWAGPGRPDPYPKESPDDREAVVRRAFDAAGPIRHGGRLLVVAHPRDDVVGVLALIDPDEKAGDDAKVAIEHGATVLAMELARLSGLAETELRLGRDLVDELLTGTDEASAIARAEALGYDLERPHRVVVVKAGPHADRHELFHAVRRAARDCGVGTLLATRGQSVVVLADTDRPWEVFRSTVGRELRGGEYRVGVGGLCDRVDDLPRSHREAVLALRVQAAAGGDHAAVFDELGVYRLLAGVDDLESVDQFVRMWLGDLLEYDANKEGSELVTTLGEYLDCGGSYDATAKALAVHRSTLKYRLQRIREISGHDLGSPEVQFNLQLAVRAWRTVRAVRGESA